MDNYDLSTDKLKTHKTYKIKPGAQNQYIHAAENLDLETITILERDYYGNPTKLLKRCKECGTPCLLLQSFSYAE